MHYNESSAPRYSRNPLTAHNGNSDSLATSKKHGNSFNSSCQMTLKTKQGHSLYGDMSSSQTSKQNEMSGCKAAARGKENRMSNKENKIKQLRKEINCEPTSCSQVQVQRVSRPIQVSRASTILDKTFT